MNSNFRKLLVIESFAFTFIQNFVISAFLILYRSANNAGMTSTLQEPNKKRLRLTKGNETVYFSEEDFVDNSKFKFQFLKDYVEQGRHIQKNLQRYYRGSVKSYKDLQKTIKEKNVLTEKGENILKVRTVTPRNFPHDINYY